MTITAYKLAKDIHIPQTRVAAILKGDRRITADTALRLSVYFGNSSKFWLGLQDDYDVEEEKMLKAKALLAIKKHIAKAAQNYQPGEWSVLESQYPHFTHVAPRVNSPPIAAC